MHHGIREDYDDGGVCGGGLGQEESFFCVTPAEHRYIHRNPLHSESVDSRSTHHPYVDSMCIQIGSMMMM